MANFSVTVTEILGTDSMNNSRVTINNNFKTLAESINTIYNTYFNNGDNTIGNSQLDIQGKNITAANKITTNAINLGSSTIDEATWQYVLNHLVEDEE